jgi:hypothetical protein
MVTPRQNIVRRNWSDVAEKAAIVSLVSLFCPVRSACVRIG